MLAVETPAVAVVTPYSNPSVRPLPTQVLPAVPTPGAAFLHAASYVHVATHILVIGSLIGVGSSHCIMTQRFIVAKFGNALVSAAVSTPYIP